MGTKRKPSRASGAISSRKYKTHKMPVEPSDEFLDQLLAKERRLLAMKRKGSWGAGSRTSRVSGAKAVTQSATTGGFTKKVRKGVPLSKVGSLMHGLSGRSYSVEAVSLVRSEMARAARAGSEDWDRIEIVAAALRRSQSASSSRSG